MDRHRLNMGKNPNIRLWRNNVGVFLTQEGQTIRVGLCKGSADLIGFESVIIDDEMVGKRVAIFRADEIKFKNGKLLEDQKKWLAMCESLGAIVNIITEDNL